jgi:hypothetical protein
MQVRLRGDPPAVNPEKNHEQLVTGPSPSIMFSAIYASRSVMIQLSCSEDSNGKTMEGKIIF